MPKPLSRRLQSMFVCVLAAALLSLALPLATSSALGAHGLRHETARASRHLATHRHHHGRRARQGSAIVRKAATTTSAALLGDEALESNRDSLIGGQAEAFPFQARVSGTAGAVHVYVDSGNAATTLLVGIYTNLKGRPGSLLVEGSLAAPPTGAWDTASVAPTPLTSGITYWLAVLGTGGTLRYRDRAHGSCKAVTSAQANLSTLAATWSAGTAYWTCPISAYVTAATVTFPVEPPAPVELGPPTTPPSEPTPPVEPPPPPPAPTNTALPTVAGTATEGQQLTATTGTWTGSPTSYAYQWQDCNASGASCANVSGATSATYKLTVADVSHTARVVVTAAGAGGSTSASSAPTAVVAAVPPPPPAASFTYSPGSPVTGQAVTFDGTGSSCPNGPCTYEWSDDGGPTRPITPLWLLGSGQTLKFTFSGAGTKYVRLVVTDATGHTATIEHNVVVEATPPPPTAPTDTAPPTISGSAEVGQTLSASSGSWSGTAPIAYAYQWQDCNAAGASCANIAGATATTHVLGAADAGHTLRALVSATNAVGSAAASSAPTAVIVEGGKPKTDCFAKPSACGYPDATNTGVPAGTTLAPSGEIVVTTNGAVISRKNVTGSIQVEANNVKIEETEITVNGSQACPGNTKPCGGYGIRVYPGYTGTVIAHDTIHGGAEEGVNALQTCIDNEAGETTTVTHSYGYHCAFGRGSGTWEDNYALLNLSIPGMHYEDFTDDGYSGKLVLRHNTFFNPHEQTTEILLQDQFGNIGEVVVENNLLAGGGYLIYGGEGGHSGEGYKVLGPVFVTGNRLARCTGTSEISENGKICKGLALGANDGYGYYPRGGYYGVFAYFNQALTTFSNNYWDNNLEVAGP